MDDAVSNQLDPIVIPGDARRLAIRNDHHCFSNLKTRFTRIDIRPFNDSKYRVTGAVQTGPRECFGELSTRGALRVDTVEKVGCMLRAFTVRRQYNCRTSSVKVERRTNLMAWDRERVPDATS